MAFVIVENLRGFFIGRPPLVVFMVCLASFAIALITFAYIVKTKDLRNPDVTEDWNTFFEKLSHLKFCVSHNVTSHNLSTPSVKVGDLTPGDALESIKDRIIENKISSNPSHTINRAVLEPQASLIRSQAAYSDRSKSESTTAQKQTTWSPSADPVSKDDTINDTFHLNIEFVPSSEFLISTFKSVYLTSDVTGNMLGLKAYTRISMSQ
uniref:TMEM248/TMEM219 domain-containing protein n=1 Tax=Arion vulgaris TaxID=1028688 RepID=A0A0B6ZUT5_9EUPU